ncbi:MAG TPA: c-type cytochrome [Burkholderiaceae bacterium]|nr:c-type cytochrome [Burkholderiaceae bacterium]
MKTLIKLMVNKREQHIVNLKGSPATRRRTSTTGGSRGAVLSFALALAMANAATATPAVDAMLPGRVVSDSSEAAAMFKQAASRPVQPFVAPTRADLPTGEAGELVRYGMELLQHTSELIGPRVVDPARRHSRNDLNCVSCHQAGPSGLPGTKPFALPLVNVVNDYPKLDPKSMKITSLVMRITGMLGQAATPIAPESREMRAMIAYITWLGSKSQPGRAMEGTGLDERMVMPARAADVARGAVLYGGKCAGCHGPQGLGVRNEGFERGRGYAIPPIAGDDAYDDGGHMYMLPLMTRFLRANMPLGASLQAPQLSVEDAYDIAAYVNTELPRKHNSSRTSMYPDVRFRAVGFAIPELFPGDDAAYRKARLGPFHPAGRLD